MEKLYYHQSLSNYEKALTRLEKTIRTGEFARYTLQKKQQVWSRICRYARQLGITIKSSVAAACFAAGLCLASPASAQTFVQKTGAANPLNLVSSVLIKGQEGFNLAPAFVDIDGDGDKDAFVGEYYGSLLYFKNTGTASSPVFVQQTGAANPFNGINFGYNPTPTFVDIDHDGDMDLFVGQESGVIRYFKNTGNATTPVFVEQTGAANPFNSVGGNIYSTIAFVDIDGDGDKDAFIGGAHNSGGLLYYKNTGSASAPVFVMQTGSANPFNGISIDYYSAPSFVDIDGDGDMDAFIGGNIGAGATTGRVRYYKNTGTATVPVFTEQTGANNPLTLVSTNYGRGTTTTPTFVDIDNDGDMDVFVGNYYGAVDYYQNQSIALPLQLLGFEGNRQEGYNKLQWQTANEVNSNSFEIERSNNGTNFAKIGSVQASGNGNNKYTFNDNGVGGKLFYRLKMVDIDDRFTYSSIIWINAGEAAGVSIYPNPARDVINLNTGVAGILKTRAGIYDANGKLVQSILINNYQQLINVQHLAKGIYSIKFADGSVKSFIKN